MTESAQWGRFSENTEAFFSLLKVSKKDGQMIAAQCKVNLDIVFHR